MPRSLTPRPFPKERSWRNSALALTTAFCLAPAVGSLLDGTLYHLVGWNVARAPQLSNPMRDVGGTRAPAKARTLTDGRGLATMASSWP
jgi:hypothetical protein